MDPYVVGGLWALLGVVVGGSCSLLCVPIWVFFLSLLMPVAMDVGDFVHELLGGWVRPKLERWSERWLDRKDDRQSRER